MTITSKQLAWAICKLGDWKVTNLKLQKIAYLIQMVYTVSRKGDKLVDDTFQAWRYGPVVPSLYAQFKEYRADKIPEEAFDDDDVFDMNSKEGRFIKIACDELLKLSAAELVAITHADGGGWDRTSSGRDISFENMRHEYEKVHGFKY